LDGFIFIQTEPGRAARVAKEVRSVQGVTKEVPVSGSYDVIARLRVADLPYLHGRVSDRLRAVEWMLRVLPSVILSALMRKQA
jgi:DNA-binding Lrp family transcriptional regulator